MNRTWLRLLVPALFLASALQACNCGTKQKAKTTSGIVVISIDGHDVTEDDTALPFAEACVASPDVPPVTKSFHLKNSGQNPLAIQSLTLSGANASSFKITAPSPVPASVAPGGDVEVDIQFAPTVQGNVSATVVVQTDDPNKGTVNVHLTGTGASKAPQPTYDLACNDPSNPDTCQTLNFPDTAVGASATAAVTIKNDGCPPLKITDVAIAGFSGTLPDGGPNFVVHGTAPSAANPIVVNTGESYDLQVDFFATDALNLALADMLVTTNGVAGSGQHTGFLFDGGALPDPIFHVALQGQGSAAQVSLTPASCDFSQTDGGSPCSATVSGSDVIGHFVLSNAGNAPVDVQSVSVPADDAGVFTVTLPVAAPFTLDASGGANAQVAFTVTYHSFNGTVVEDLVAATSVGNFSSHLSAGNPAVIVAPAILNFNQGGVDPLLYSSPQTLTVQDTGTGALIIQTPTIGQDPGDGGEVPCTYTDSSGNAQPRFTVDSPTFPLTIQPSASSDLTISHHRDPSIGGAIECALHLPNNDPGQPDAIVRLQAATYVNCDPYGTFTPTGPLTASASIDGGVYVVDANGSFDTSDTTTPRCPNGQDDGLQSFHWTLTVPPPSAGGPPHFGTHLEPVVTSGFTCASNNDGGCVDLTVNTGTTNFGPYGDLALVNVVVDGNDPAATATLKLEVADTTGRKSTSNDTLTISPQP